MNFNIISRTNGVGLDRDIELVKGVVEGLGHSVTVSGIGQRTVIDRVFKKSSSFDANIHLERAFPNWYASADKNILIPNQERFPRRHLKRLQGIDLVLAKSEHAREIFCDLGSQTGLIKFTSHDLYKPEVKKDYSKFLHLAGRSTLKGTEVILKLWEKNPQWPTLTLIQNITNAPPSVPSNVDLITRYVPQEELTEIINSHGIHLCPSRSEGWGHYIVEAMSTKAVVITTDAPPMNELVAAEAGLLVNYKDSKSRHLGTNFYVDEEHLEEVIDRAISAPSAEKQQLGENARAWFLSNHDDFHLRLTNEVKTLNRSVALEIEGNTSIKRGTMATYLINLDRSPERLAHSTTLLNEYKIPFDRYSAIDGETLDMSAYESAVENHSFYHLPLKPNEVACYLSHISALKQFLSTDKSHVLILEDDFRWLADPTPVLNEVIANDDYDVVKLFSRKERKIYKVFKELKATCPESSDHYKLLKFPSAAIYNTGQLFTRAGARKIIKSVESIKRPLDVELKHYWEHDIKVYSVFPNVIGHSDLAGESTIGDRRRDRTIVASIKKQLYHFRYGIKKWWYFFLK